MKTGTKLTKLETVFKVTHYRVVSNSCTAGSTLPSKISKECQYNRLVPWGIRGTVDVFEKYHAGLKDIEGFSHIILIYHFHLSKGYSLEVKPFMDEEAHGIFATRGPARPNPIGISTVHLVKVEGCTLHIEDIDIIDGTPLLDMKPYVPDFDRRGGERVGWLSGKSSNVRQKNQMEALLVKSIQADLITRKAEFHRLCSWGPTYA
jgi:tRNA-Thr(GGU) m(6)t(6)A37 methyltransferase TsaA